MNKPAIVKWIWAVLLMPVIAPANAQSPPNVQTVSVRAPGDIKIDGEATEWGNKFQAYNKADVIYYTLSNDDANLYLIISAPDQYAIEKIGNGGITFTISHSINAKTRAKEIANVSVRFPLINLAKSSGLGPAAREYQDLKKDEKANQKAIDSLVITRNTKFAEMFKLLKVKGVKELTDSLLSIYNTEGIKVAAQFNKKFVYTYELALPLKYLGISASEASTFSYNIKLNGPPTNEEWLKAGKYPPPQITRDGGGVDHEYQYISNPTDFWGEYTLAKK